MSEIIRSEASWLDTVDADRPGPQAPRLRQTNDSSAGREQSPAKALKKARPPKRELRRPENR